MQNRGSSTRCDHKPSRETSLSESSFAIRRRSITTVDLVSPPAPCRKGCVRVQCRKGCVHCPLCVSALPQGVRAATHTPGSTVRDSTRGACACSDCTLWSAGVWSCVDRGAAAVRRSHRGGRRCAGSRRTLSEICSSICLSCESESASRSWLRCAIIRTMSSSLRACVRGTREQAAADELTTGEFAPCPA